jgi:hypothetical protein
MNMTFNSKTCLGLYLSLTKPEANQPHDCDRIIGDSYGNTSGCGFNG